MNQCKFRTVVETPKRRPSTKWMCNWRRNPVTTSNLSKRENGRWDQRKWRRLVCLTFTTSGPVWMKRMFRSWQWGQLDNPGIDNRPWNFRRRWGVCCRRWQWREIGNRTQNLRSSDVKLKYCYHRERSLLFVPFCCFWSFSLLFEAPAHLRTRE